MLFLTPNQQCQSNEGRNAENVYIINGTFSWLLNSKLVSCGHAQGTKIYGKSSLKYVPLIGWAWMFTESIFLRRDWDRDRQTISHHLQCIRDYPDGYWVTVSNFSISVVPFTVTTKRMVRWMCGIKLEDRFSSKELRERLGIDDIALVLQQNRL